MEIVKREIIKDNYKYNYNIVELYEKIKKSYILEYNKSYILKNEIKKLQWIKKNSNNEYEKLLAKKKLIIYYKQYIDIKNMTKLKQYIKLTNNIIQLYKEILPKKKLIFGMKNDNYDDKYKKQRLLLIYKFIFYSKSFYPLDIKKIGNHHKLCPICDSELNKELSGLHCSNINCRYYQETIEIICNNTLFKEKNTACPYDCKENFYKIILCFQGKQSKRPSKNVYNNIYLYCNKNDINYKTISKFELSQILQILKLTDHYVNLNLIHSIITGINPPDISVYEDNLLYRYDLYEEIYNTIKHTIKERKNSLQIHFLLQHFLCMEGYDVNHDDFLYLKTRDVQLNHNYTMKICCNLLQHKYPDMNWTYHNIY
jgi:hypothetical protein